MQLSATDARDLRSLMLRIAHQVADNRVERAREGLILANSYDPKDGTVTVQVGDTLAIDDSDGFGDSFGVEERVPLVSTQVGDQHGPRGGERVLLIPIDSGYAAILHHGEDDSPGAPAGERWIEHRNASGVVDAYIRLTNDATAGDGAASIAMLAGKLLEILTAAGFGIRLDDSARTSSLFSPGGLSITLDDAANKVFIGRPGLSQPDSVMTQSDAQTLANAIITSVQNAINGLASLAQPGGGIPKNPLYVIAPVTAQGSSEIDSAE